MSYRLGRKIDVRWRRAIQFVVSGALVAGAASVPVNAQTCGAQGIAVQVLGSGGPELQDKRASSSYLVWEDGQARVLVDAGGGSALRFGESGATMSHLDVMNLVRSGKVFSQASAFVVSDFTTSGF